MDLYKKQVNADITEVDEKLHDAEDQVRLYKDENVRLSARSEALEEEVNLIKIVLKQARVEIAALVAE